MLNYLLPASFIVGLIFLAINPTLIIFMLAFFVPIINWTFHVGGLEIPFSDLIATAALSGWLLSLLYQLFFKPNAKIQLNFPLFFPFALFLGANFLSLLNHPHPIDGFYYLSRWLLLLYAAYIFLPINTIKNEKALKISVLCLALSSLIVAMSGYLSFLGQDLQNSFFRLKSITWWGVYPFGENHNLIAEFLCVGAFLWLALKEWSHTERTKRICIGFFTITIIAVILTFSRAAWITVGLQLGIYIIWRNREFFKKQGALFILVVAAVAILILPIFWRMSLLQADNTSSTENRVLLTEIAYNNWIEQPVIGQGSGRFTSLVENNIRFTAKYGLPIDSHGFIQKIAAETGLLGLITWFFLLAVIAKKGITGLKKYSQKAPWLLPLWIAAGGGMFFQIFNTSYYKGKVWLIITLALIATELARKQYGQKD